YAAHDDLPTEVGPACRARPHPRQVRLGKPDLPLATDSKAGFHFQDRTPTGPGPATKQHLGGGFAWFAKIVYQLRPVRSTMRRTDTALAIPGEPHACDLTPDRAG